MSFHLKFGQDAVILYTVIDSSLLRRVLLYPLPGSVCLVRIWIVLSA